MTPRFQSSDPGTKRQRRNGLDQALTEDHLWQEETSRGKMPTVGGAKGHHSQTSPALSASRKLIVCHACNGLGTGKEPLCLLSASSRSVQKATFHRQVRVEFMAGKRRPLSGPVALPGRKRNVCMSGVVTPPRAMHCSLTASHDFQHTRNA